MNPQTLSNLINATSTIFGKEGLYRNYPLPVSFSWQRQTQKEHPGNFVRVNALWTTDELRPRWDNLGLIVDFVNPNNEIAQWQRLLTDLPIKYAVLISNFGYQVVFRSNEQVEIKFIGIDELKPQLIRLREEVFSPRTLGRLRTGQLSFADIEEAVTPTSFTFLLRQKGELDKALKNAILSAQEVETENQQQKFQGSLEPHQKTEIYESVLSVATAFLAARILEDKGFFGEGSMPTFDPEQLLKRTVTETNGFFKRALEVNLPKLSWNTQQKLAQYLGASISFSLVDHRDVGRLYEQASIIFTRKLSELEKETGRRFDSDLINLQRHYTPFPIANKMLKMLPLERLRPDERTVMDLAAGSGSLLSAATLRLGSMSDIPQGEGRTNYLRKHVVGNDKDPLASLVTKLRYLLINQVIGNKDANLFPSPEHFDSKDYNDYSKETLPNNPRVWVANPPFAEQGTQQAFEFIEMVSHWMKKGDQFAFILPQVFLNGTGQGAPEARQALMSQSEIFEVWQLPEGVVGLSAQQPVCVIVGTVSEKEKQFTVSRAIYSRKEKAVIQENGLLGKPWVTKIAYDADKLTSVIFPSVDLKIPTIPLNELYFYFVGVTPRKGIKPIPEKIEGVNCKPYWQIGWREKGRIWADPNRVDPDKRYIRYEKDSLNAIAEENKEFFELPKIMIAHSMNRDTQDNIAAHFDDYGFFTSYHTWCICPKTSTNKPLNHEVVPHEWLELTEEDQLLWLLGILTTNVARNLLNPYRTSRHLDYNALGNFLLPKQIDDEIIVLTKEILKRDKNHEPIPNPDLLRENLNWVVARSYGISQPQFKKWEFEETLEILNKRNLERVKPKVTVTGQVLDVNSDRNEVLLYLSGILDEESEVWVQLPYELPGWALERNIFTADLSADINTFAEISARPWALRNFKHSPRPYLTVNELRAMFSSLTDQKSVQGE